ncbi:MAG: glycosyltransferase family 39 protein [Sphingobacteriaceae bacterium]|nr:glycosyltransferase family 39 protein [Sphingobacteriaceae bacterium]
MIAGLIFIPLIGNCPLFDWDEINFAECAREMLITGNYSPVQIHFQPFWEKPPFFIWMQAFCMNMFGIGEFAARLPNAICGIFTIVTLYLVGKKLFSQKFGLLWALIHAGTLLPSLYFKSGVIDPWFNYFIFLSLILFIVSIHTENSKKWLYTALSGIILGIAVLTKGPAALLIEGTCIFLFLVLSGNFKFLFKPLFFFFVFTILFSSSSWFLFQYLNGKSYILEQFINYQIRLFQTEDSGHSGPFIYHFIVLLLGCFPTSILFILSYRNKTAITLPQSHTRLILLVLFWVVLLLFSIVKTKIVHYSSLCYFPISFIATFGILHKDIGKVFGLALKTLFIIIASLFSLLFILFTQINTLKQFLLEKDLIKDEFAKLNLNAELVWYGYEWLIPVLFLFAMYFVFKGIKTNAIRSIAIGFALNIIFIVGAINTFVPKVELITQHAAIAFYQQSAKYDCYVETNDFKSYAYIFYSDRRPHHYQSKSLVDYIEYFYSVQEKDAFKLNFYATANCYWMKTNEIDKPAFLVSKTPNDHDLGEFPYIKEMYRSNGFSFFVRMPGPAK